MQLKFDTLGQLIDRMAVCPICKGKREVEFHTSETYERYEQQLTDTQLSLWIRYPEGTFSFVIDLNTNQYTEAPEVLHSISEDFYFWAQASCRTFPDKWPCSYIASSDIELNSKDKKVLGFVIEYFTLDYYPRSSYAHYTVGWDDTFPKGWYLVVRPGDGHIKCDGLFEDADLSDRVEMIERIRTFLTFS